MVADLQALLDRVKAATGPDRDLDGAVEVQARRFRAYAAGLTDSTRAHWKHNGCTVYDGNTGYDAERYTGSIDAALALVERLLPGWEWGVNTNRSKGWHWADVHPVVAEGKTETAHSGRASTPSLAILAALLSALIARGQP